MEESNWRGAYPYWIMEPQKKEKEQEEKEKKLCVHPPNVRMHGVI
jgi:hypothetical protein